MALKGLRNFFLVIKLFKNILLGGNSTRFL